MKREDFEIIVGVITLVIGAIFLTFAFTGSGFAERKGYPVVAVFNQADGLGIGAEVRLAGIPVGEVSAMEFNSETNQAVVTMTIDETVKLPLDSAVLIGSDGLMGDKFIKIEPGGDIEMVKPGGRIEFTQDSVIFEELLEKIVKSAEERRAQEKAAKKEQAE